MDFFEDDGFGWEEMAMAGSLAEEMTEEEIERIRAEQDTLNLDNDDLGLEKEEDVPQDF